VSSYPNALRFVRAVILMLAKLTVVLASCLVGATAEPNDAVKRTQMIRTIEAHVQEMSPHSAATTLMRGSLR